MEIFFTDNLTFFPNFLWPQEFQTKFQKLGGCPNKKTNTSTLGMTA